MNIKLFKIKFRNPIFVEIDIRYFKFLIQKIKRGFSDDELWNLSEEMALFMLPRLEEFKIITDGIVPSNYNNREEWVEVLDEMIWYFETIKLMYQKNKILNNEEYERFEKAKNLVAENLETLWY